jgi:hypothetical protein
MVGASDVDTSSTYCTSSSSSSEDEGDRHKSRKSSKNLSELSCFARDGFCTMALSPDSKMSTQSDSDSNSDDEVCDELPFLRQENERLGLFLDNRDDMLREAKKMRKLSYGPPWAHYLGGYQDRLLCGTLGLPGLCHTAPDGVRCKDYGGEVFEYEAILALYCVEDS